MINESAILSGTQTLQTPEYFVINSNQFVVSILPSKKQGLSGMKTLHSDHNIAMHFSNNVVPSCLDDKKRNPTTAVKFFKENAAKNLRNILEKISDLSKNIFEKKTRQSSECFAINFNSFVESLCAHNKSF